MAIAGDRVSVTVTVGVEPAVAFEVFTQEIDRWWRKGKRYRIGRREPSVICLEPGIGGRVFEQYEGNDGTRVHESGRITVWDPPAHLAFEWRGVNFAPGEVTLVDVTFTATETGTRVVLDHSGFAKLRPDHPVRHGEPDVQFIRRLGLWWGDLLKGLRERIDDRS
jgi:uncharacterized protein YndB with AHSA1/START domain